MQPDRSLVAGLGAAVASAAAVVCVYLATHDSFRFPDWPLPGAPDSSGPPLVVNDRPPAHHARPAPFARSLAPALLAPSAPAAPRVVVSVPRRQRVQRVRPHRIVRHRASAPVVRIPAPAPAPAPPSRPAPAPAPALVAATPPPRSPSPASAPGDEQPAATTTAQAQRAHGGQGGNKQQGRQGGDQQGQDEGDRGPAARDVPSQPASAMQATPATPADRPPTTDDREAASALPGHDHHDDGEGEG